MIENSTSLSGVFYVHPTNKYIIVVMYPKLNFTTPK
jgi:hypothetical protein